MNDYITRKGGDLCPNMSDIATSFRHRYSTREVGPIETGGATSQHTWIWSWQQLHGGHSSGHTAVAMSEQGVTAYSQENEEDEEQSFHDAAESWEHYDSWGAHDWNSSSWGNPHSYELAETLHGRGHGTPCGAGPSALAA